MTAGKLISTKADFPNVQVFLRVENSRPVLSVVFENREFKTAKRQIAASFALLSMMAIVPVTIYLGQLAQRMGLPWYFGSGPFFAVAVTPFFLAFRAFYVSRTIELDLGRDRLRVWKDGRPEVERQLSRLANLTVEDDPNAESARVRRQQKRDDKLKEVEKQHCLFGWFGARGAERVLLLTRAEWPSLHSLIEVQQAVIWAKGMGEALEQEALRTAPVPDSQPEPAQLPQVAPAQLALPRGRGIKPPLD